MPVGIAIINEDNSASLFYHNPALDELVEQIKTPQEVISTSFDNLLNSFAIKIVSKVSNATVATHSFGSFVKQIINPSDETYFIDCKERLIELRISKVMYDVDKAKLISFIDCTSAQRLEKIQTENKYKTQLIATISHELRTPLNAVVGTLDLISQYVPQESRKELEIAKESCNLITFHINDLTVQLNLELYCYIGLWKDLRIRAANTSKECQT